MFAESSPQKDYELTLPVSEGVLDSVGSFFWMVQAETERKYLLLTLPISRICEAPTRATPSGCEK